MKTSLILTICCLTIFMSVHGEFSLQNNTGDISPTSNDSPAMASLGPHGLLLLYKNGKSGTVCDDGFDNRAAKVVCRMLGLPVGNATALKLGDSGKGGPESMNIILHGIDCTGKEDNFENCKSSKLWSNCDHSEDVGVSCEQGATTAVPDERIGQNKSLFTYSSDLISIIGKPLVGSSFGFAFSLYGPVMSLDDSGNCPFDPADHYGSSEEVDQKWKWIAAGSYDWISSQYILLPNHWGGMIVRIRLESRNEKEFQIRLSSPEVNHNWSIKLPQLIKIQMEMNLSNGDRFFSRIVQFEVKKLRSAAASREPFLIPLKNVNRSKLPQIHFQFME